MPLSIGINFKFPRGANATRPLNETRLFTSFCTGIDVSEKVQKFCPKSMFSNGVDKLGKLSRVSF